MQSCWPVNTLLIATLAGCPTDDVIPQNLDDDPVAYIESALYRRAILERDLTEFENAYARRRLARYAPDGAWNDLAERDPASSPLLVTATEALLLGVDVPIGPGAVSLEPSELPETDEAWIELGRRVFFDFPLRVDTTYEALATVEGGLAASGFLQDDGAWVGLRAFTDYDGSTRIGNTCAQCHASRDANGDITGVLSNRQMDVGRALILTLGYEPGALPPEIESTSVGDLDRLGPGRTDLLSDGEFNPYAFPDFGGIVDMPYLHQNANWFHNGTATLAVRCETLFITAINESRRPPRVLTWALAMYLRSLPAPAPISPGGPEAARGAEIFEAAGCEECHTPPLFTSDRQVTLAEVGTNPSAGASDVRWTGHYRIPSLRGVGRAAPYLHHGAFATLEAMFDPERTESGHVFGLELDAAERADLIAFLRSI